jgi:hypothetical protein
MSQGDIAFTTAKSITGLVLVEFIVTFAPTPAITIIFAEGAGGPQHVVRLTDANATGFDYAAGVFTDGVARAVTGEMTAMLGVLFKVNAKTLGIQRLVTDGVITVPGTVG